MAIGEYISSYGGRQEEGCEITVSRVAARVVVAAAWHTEEEEVSFLDVELVHVRTLCDDLVVKRARTTLRICPGPDPNCSSPSAATSGATATIAIDAHYCYPAVTAKRDCVLRFVIRSEGFSSGPWNLTNCQDVPLSEFPLLDFWAPASVSAGTRIANPGQTQCYRFHTAFVCVIRSVTQPVDLLLPLGVPATNKR